jgi:hypothetical protein
MAAFRFCACCGHTRELALVAVVPRQWLPGDSERAITRLWLCPTRCCTTNAAWRRRWRLLASENAEAA